MPKQRKALDPLDRAGSVKDVLHSIDKIINWSMATAQPSRIGYFAALYKGITLAVEQSIEHKGFQDCARMEKFDYTFANRYFDALNGHFHPNDFPNPTKTWQLSLDAAQQKPPIIVQHLLGGCNAHIALDLGITAHTIAQGDLPGLRHDFDKINDILAGQTSAVVNRIDKVSPVLADVHAVLNNYEIDFIDKLLMHLRARAWDFANLLSDESNSLQINKTIAARDSEMAQLGQIIYEPPIPMLAILDAVAAEEQRNVARNIQVLDEIASAPYRPATGPWLCGFVQSRYRELRGLASAALEPAFAAIRMVNASGRANRR